MSNLIELFEHARGLTASETIFLVCIAALVVAWKALDVVGRLQGKGRAK